MQNHPGLQVISVILILTRMTSSLVRSTGFSLQKQPATSPRCGASGPLSGNCRTTGKAELQTMRND